MILRTDLDTKKKAGDFQDIVHSLLQAGESLMVIIFLTGK